MKLMLVLSGIIENYDYSLEKHKKMCVVHSIYCSHLKCYSLNCEGSYLYLVAQRSLRSSGPALPQI